MICLTVLTLARPADAQDFWSDSPGVSSQAINDAIDRCMVYVSTKPGRAGTGLSECYRYMDGGAEALLALAKIEAGENPNQPELGGAIEGVLNRNPNKVFSRAIRTALLCELAGHAYTSSTIKKTLLKKLQVDVDWLVRHQLPGGGWGEPAGPGNTNDTAEVLRAIKIATGLGAKVKPDIWNKARRFLRKVQNADGGFGFFPRGTQPARLRGASNGSATAAGASALTVLLNKNRRYSKIDKKNRQRALAWLDRNYRIEHVPAWKWGAEPLHSYLYDLAFATGRPMRLGGRDVDAEIATFLISQQQRNGAWSGQKQAEDDIVGSAWAIRSLRLIQPAKAQPALANQEPGRVIFTPAGPQHPQTFKPKRFLIVGRVAVPDSNIESKKIADKLSDALAQAISIGVRHQNFYPNDTQAQSVPNDLSMLWLTGKRPSDYDSITSDRIRAFIQQGGVLLIDSTNGSQSEFNVAQANLAKIFSLGDLEPIPASDPLITGNFGPGLGCDLTSIKYNTSILKHLSPDDAKPQGPPLLWAVRKRGRIVVVLSRFALAGPAGGKNSPQIPGYVPLDARRIILNVLLYANSNKWRIETDTRE